METQALVAFGQMRFVRAELRKVILVASQFFESLQSLGQNPTSPRGRATSALPPASDIGRETELVRVKGTSGKLRRAKANRGSTIGARNQITLLTCKTRYPLIAGTPFYSQQSRGRICLVEAAISA